MNRSSSRTQLPLPSADALAASEQLKAVIRAQMTAYGGWLSFARFMELALFAPRLGYYSGGATKFGKDGDFTTAPEISPLFGQSVAQFAMPLMQQSKRQMLEFGAGSGKLAHDVLSRLHQQGFVLEKYFIVEVSGQLRAAQEERLAGFSEVEWLEQLPEQFDGVIIGNEVLDAMPVQLVQKDESGDNWSELGVVWQAMSENDGEFAWQTRPMSDQVQQQLTTQIPDAENLPPGYISELHSHASAFMRSVSSMLAGGSGAAIWFDYGFAAHEYYLDQRRNGTLMCHYRHHAHAEPFFLPGLQDITAHVDFSAMAKMALASGLELLSYSHQAGFLLDAGITQLMQELDPNDVKHYLPQTNAVGKLLAPHEMGELFKTLVVGKNVHLPPDWGRFARQARL